MKRKNKNQNSTVRAAWNFLEKEIAAVLALLVLLTFIFSYSHAATPEAAPATDSPSNMASLKVAQTVSPLNIEGESWDGLNYSSAKNAAYYKVAQFSPTVAQTATGAVATLANAEYTATVTLDSAIPAGFKWYLSAEAANVSVNGKSVVNGNTALDLTGATSITVKWKDGRVKSLGLTPAGSTTPIVAKPAISTLYVTPASANVMVERELRFIAFALSADGQEAAGAIAWSTSDSAIATINESGVLTGVTPGSVTVTAKSGSLSASATITVKAKPTVTTIVTPPVTETTPSASKTIVAQPEETKPAEPTTVAVEDVNDFDSMDRLAVNLTQPSEEKVTLATNVKLAVATLYSPQAIAERVVVQGKLFPSAAEVRAVVASQPTAVTRLATRVSLAFTEIRISLTQMATGYSVTNAEGTVVAQRPGVVRQIGASAWNLLTGNEGSFAGTLRIGPDEDTNN